jgi:hypothetical protein
MTNCLEDEWSRRNRVQVRELFWQHWDPIGVNDCENAEDEYDTYADRAYAMLMDENRSADEITDYLYFISSDHMGLGQSQALKNLAIEIADRLVALKPTFGA